jgi:hypothetical protein
VGLVVFLVSNLRCGEWLIAWFPIHRVVRGIANSHYLYMDDIVLTDVGACVDDSM